MIDSVNTMYFKDLSPYPTKRNYELYFLTEKRSKKIVSFEQICSHFKKRLPYKFTTQELFINEEFRTISLIITQIIYSCYSFGSIKAENNLILSIFNRFNLNICFKAENNLILSIFNRFNLNICFKEIADYKELNKLEHKKTNSAFIDCIHPNFKKKHLKSTVKISLDKLAKNCLDAVVLDSFINKVRGGEVADAPFSAYSLHCTSIVDHIDKNSFIMFTPTMHKGSLHSDLQAKNIEEKCRQTGIDCRKYHFTYSSNHVFIFNCSEDANLISILDETRLNVVIPAAKYLQERKKLLPKDCLKS